MSDTLTVEQALAALQKEAPDVPFLALGQTIFWDEPMKGGILLASQRMGYKRKLVAGVHDTDYFAKLPKGIRQPGKFKAYPHNDTTTKGLWSAAAEFSTLFGSETVVTREILQSAGLKIGKVARAKPNLLDRATEAWGWKGIVSLDEQPPVTAEVPLRGLIQELHGTLKWAMEATLACLSGADRDQASQLSEVLEGLLCEGAEREGVSTLGDLYAALIQEVYDFCAKRHVDLEPTRTMDLLRFNTITASLPRFGLLGIFLKHPDAARTAYDAAIAGSEIYPLARFGTGAIPFDLIVPGKGRGTIRIAPRAVVIGTPEPIVIPLKQEIGGIDDLAAAIERKLGSNCVLVGKAVTLIGMLAAEFVFIFHEGGSPYVKHSRRLHDLLAPVASNLALNPILRVKYSPWDELDTCCAWLRLPEPLRNAFGAEDICAPSLAMRWREVADEQETLLRQLGELKRPIELIRFLDARVGGSWSALAAEYERLHDQLDGLRAKVEEMKGKRAAAYASMRTLRRERVKAEHAKGEHFRAKIFEKAPSPDDLKERDRLTREVDQTALKLKEAKAAIRKLMRDQQAIGRSVDNLRLRDRRQSIEIEAELKRLALIRDAVISGPGLRRASNRPSAWWLPLVCPDGLWFRSTVENAECHLEPLQSSRAKG